MNERPQKRLFPNPFYVLLLAASTLFVLTALGYLAGPLIHDEVRPRAGRASEALADWLDRRGPLALAVEVALMILSGLLAMATDRWFPAKADRKSGTTPAP